MLEIWSLPAREGDAIWIRWGDAAAPHQMIVDMGTEGSGKKVVRERLRALPEAQRKLDLLVITHVDADHIGGVLTCLAEAERVAGFEVEDVWFNGFAHLSGGAVQGGGKLEPLGPAQGERLSKWLKGQPWNRAFEGRPVRREPDRPVQTATLHDGLKLTVLGPTPDRLGGFVATWRAEVQEAIEKRRLDPAELSPGLEPMGAANAPILRNAADLLALAQRREREFDDGKANGTSIALLLEYGARKLLLAGDAFSPDLVEGIRAVSPGEPLRLDVFKLPHHGSRNNVHRALIEAVDCERWLISTDGTKFEHPDAEAIARILQWRGARKPVLAFNVPSRFNQWWKNEAWQASFGYETEYGSAEEGWSFQFE